jgi:hypothetical protein
MISNLSCRTLLFLVCLAQLHVAQPFVLDGGSKFKKTELRISNSPNQNSPEWTLPEDWALMDTVPKFSVGDDSQARTFWAQLSAATPTLSRFAESDLQERYATLRNQSAFPPPPVLQDWTITDESEKMSGQLEGRTVWFPIQMVGRLQTDPIKLDTVEAISGGFVEALGGRVYELGQPSIRRESFKSSDTPMREKDKPSILPNVLPNFPWVSATTATVSALIVSAIISASIGYGSGLSIASVETRESSLRTARSIPPTVTVQSSGQSATRSVSEQRARTEVRVLREQRVIKSVTERLEQDQVDLQRLRQEEAATGSLAP